MSENDIKPVTVQELREGFLEVARLCYFVAIPVVFFAGMHACASNRTQAPSDKIETAVPAPQR